MLIEKNGIAKDVPIFAVSGGSIEEYAKKNGNPFTALDGEIPKSSPCPQLAKDLKITLLMAVKI